MYQYSIFYILQHNVRLHLLEAKAVDIKCYKNVNFASMEIIESRKEVRGSEQNAKKNSR